MNGHRQRGMAIISALLIVTVVAVIAAGLIARQSAFIRALESEQLRIQAGWLNSTAEVTAGKANPKAT
ncbi:hypothetical protein ACLBTQ_16410, partial [Pseudomonas aeruginosa]